LPDLRYLEQKYPDALTVIGLHSPKFPQERVAAHVRKAINRYHIRHPVANDPKFQVWRQYGIRAWPTVIFIDPEGYVVGALPGEGRRRQLDQLIQRHLNQAERQGLRRAPTVTPRPHPEPRVPLSFPGKVCASSDRVYLSDSGHNRILELRPNGTVVRVFGSGSLGLVDGRLEESSFNDPQGLTRADEFLFVADTGNHAIRKIHLLSGEVQTIAGNGTLGRHAGERFDDPHQAPLNSPWDVAYDDGVLYIAMAGQHQIWAMDLKRSTLGVHTGSGREDIVDGPCKLAAMAQPSGLALAAGRLYVADAETSSIRVVDLTAERLDTLVGIGLFEFGDQDGIGVDARLQHPLGVAWDAGRDVLWIADSYNNKIKRLDVTTHSISTLNLDHPLEEPGGISSAGDTLWVANTNAHTLLRVDPVRGHVEVVEVPA
ncbi:MAG: alkyl hydroperoxide reductase, partial [Gammaproteobacteria bacterium]